MFKYFAVGLAFSQAISQAIISQAINQAIKNAQDESLCIHSIDPASNDAALLAHLGTKTECHSQMALIHLHVADKGLLEVPNIGGGSDLHYILQFHLC